MSKKSELERMADLAIEKHRRRLHLVTMELLLSDMIRLAGIHEVRKLLTKYLDDLGEFDRQGDP